MRVVDCCVLFVDCCLLRRCSLCVVARWLLVAGVVLLSVGVARFVLFRVLSMVCSLCFSLVVVCYVGVCCFLVECLVCCLFLFNAC